MSAGLYPLANVVLPSITTFFAAILTVPPLIASTITPANIWLSGLTSKDILSAVWSILLPWVETVWPKAFRLVLVTFRDIWSALRVIADSASDTLPVKLLIVVLVTPNAILCASIVK